MSSVPEEARIIKMARDINDGKPQWVIDQVTKAIEDKKAPVVAALGIAFKNDIDDLRESPSLNIVKRLGEEHPKLDIRVVEPNVEELPPSLSSVPNLRKQDLAEALTDAEVVLLLVNHKEFIALDRSELTGKTVIDTKGIWR